MANREQWIEACGSLSVAVNTEDSILSCGREFLPPHVVTVLDGAEPGPDYWDFLLEQLGKIEEQDSVSIDGR